jgi:hypothetical protein
MLAPTLLLVIDCFELYLVNYWEIMREVTFVEVFISLFNKFLSFSSPLVFLFFPLYTMVLFFWLNIYGEEALFIKLDGDLSPPLYTTSYITCILFAGVLVLCPVPLLIAYSMLPSLV